ncbi:MAG: peptidoglycan-associated lipoprotein Pal [Syntrophales bacterium]|nr:peptidoglycan-associated lipoprotein Pal [Syntrophales bacterium]
MRKYRKVLVWTAVWALVFGLLAMTGCAKKQVQPQAGEVVGEQSGSQAQTQTQTQVQPREGTAVTTTAAKPETKPAAVPAEEEQAARAAEAEAKARAEAKAQELARQAAETKAREVTDVELKDIHFDFDQSTLRPDARAILKEHAAWLLKNPGVSVLIEGHCDERGTNEYNLALGDRRANETMKYLVELGVAKERIKTISYGEERPLDPGHNEAAWAKNRRAHFVITVN